MELHLEDYLGKRRDTTRERELVVRLRELPEETRFEYIQQVLQKDMVVGLELANSCLQSRCHFVSLMKQGLQVADASSMSLWLETVTPHLGFRRVTNILIQSIESNPQAVEKALYWLPSVLPIGDDKAVMQVQELAQNLKEAKRKKRSKSESVSTTL